MGLFTLCMHILYVECITVDDKGGSTGCVPAGCRRVAAKETGKTAE